MFTRTCFTLLALLLITGITGCAGPVDKTNEPRLLAVEVTPSEELIAAETGRQFLATGIYSDNTKKDLTDIAEWSSSDTAVALVNNPETASKDLPDPASARAGYVYAVEEGAATITASIGEAPESRIALAGAWQEVIRGTGNLKVKRVRLTSITITPANQAISNGTKQQFTAMGTFSDSSTQDITTTVTWSSSNSGVATVSNTAGSNGLATSVAAGFSTITAASKGIAGSAQLTVNPSTLVSLEITPVDQVIAKGTNMQFTATGTYSDETTQKLSAVSWSSSNTAVATISNSAGSNGLATSAGAGTTTIRATSGTLSVSTTLTVSPATLVSLAVTPPSASAVAGTTQQFLATGKFSDNTTQDLTEAVLWSSSNTAVSTISNAAGSNGLASALAAGSATIKGISGNVLATAAFTVTAGNSGTASLAWDAPSTNSDGTPLTDLAGYRLHYGTVSGIYGTTINVGNVTSYVVEKLSPGTYYFVVTAVNKAGSESGYSNVANKTL